MRALLAQHKTHIDILQLERAIVMPRDSNANNSGGYLTILDMCMKAPERADIKKNVKGALRKKKDTQAENFIPETDDMGNYKIAEWGNYPLVNSGNDLDKDLRPKSGVFRMMMPCDHHYEPKNEDRDTTMLLWRERYKLR